MNNSPSTVYLARVDEVEQRLKVLMKASRRGLTNADGQTGDRWTVEQVWAHLAEFVPYWISEAEHLIAVGSTVPQPFGRTKDDQGRLAGIEEGRHRPLSELQNTLL